MIDEFLQMMNRGGPVMWVIFVTAWIAIIMLCERAIQLQMWLSKVNRQVDPDKADQQQHHPANSTQLKRGDPISYIINTMDGKKLNDKEELAAQINIQLSEVMPRLQGNLPTIAILGSLLPMLGLLGTVVGMIEVFDVVAIHGTGDPKLMANGISQALLTTASGLIIAIPVIFFHHVLSKQLNLLTALTEQGLLNFYHSCSFPSKGL